MLMTWLKAFLYSIVYRLLVCQRLLKIWNSHLQCIHWQRSLIEWFFVSRSLSSWWIQSNEIEGERGEIDSLLAACSFREWIWFFQPLLRSAKLSDCKIWQWLERSLPSWEEKKIEKASTRNLSSISLSICLLCSVAALVHKHCLQMDETIRLLEGQLTHLLVVLLDHIFQLRPCASLASEAVADFSVSCNCRLLNADLLEQSLIPVRAVLCLHFTFSRLRDISVSIDS